MRTWLLNSTALKGPEGAGSDSGTGAEPGPAPAPAPEATSSDLRALLDFDPFEPAPAGQEEKTAPAAESSPSPAGKERKAGDAPVPPKGADSEAPKPDAVAEQLAQVSELLRQQAEINARKTEEKKETAPKGPRFNLSIPENITKKLLISEDPTERAQGLLEFANGLSNFLYEQISAETISMLGNLVKRIPEIARNEVTEVTSQAEMSRDFWDSVSGNHIPEAQRLPKTQAMGQFVAITAQTYAKELAAKGQRPAWTPEFRNEVVKRVYEGLGRQVPQAGGNGVSPSRGTPPGQRAPKAPSFATGQSGRGDTTQFKSEVQKDIAELFE